MLVALAVAVLLQKRLNFIAVVLGMLGLKVGALFAPFFLKRLYPEHFVTQEEE
jgi:hypothetical protein